MLQDHKEQPIENKQKKETPSKACWRRYYQILYRQPTFIQYLYPWHFHDIEDQAFYWLRR